MINILRFTSLDSILVDHNEETLENSINFIHEKDDIFLGLNATMYETLKKIIMINMNIFFQILILQKIYLMIQDLEMWILNQI